MRLTILCAAVAGLCSPAHAQQPAPAKAKPVSSAVAAPPEVVASAVAAVRSLGEQVVLSRYKVAIERMNPLWKERTASRLKGGIQELEKQLEGVAQQMQQQGVSMISFQPFGTPRAFEVWPGKEVDPATGAETLIYTKWLILVPTKTQFRIIREGTPKFVVIENTGFQVAISDKGKNDWTFIDGSGLSPAELRSLFGNLPADLELPPLDRRKVE